MTGYKVVKKLSDDLIVLTSTKYGEQMWYQVTLRKNTTCEEYCLPLSKGDRAFRPNTHGYNRMHRISLLGMNNLLIK